MTPQLYSQREPLDGPVDETRCEWAVPSWTSGWYESGIWRQCSRKVRVKIDGHRYCHRHAKMVRDQ